MTEVNKSRLILCGHFCAGEENEIKRRFWLDAPNRLSTLFDEFLILEQSFKGSRVRISPWSIRCATDYWFQHPPHLILWLIGVYAIVVMFLRGRGFLWELLCLETVVAKARPRRFGLADILWLGFKALCGLGRIWLSLQDLKLTQYDVVVLFSEHKTSSRMVKAATCEAGARLIHSEYGELPKSLFVSELGMFHESWPAVEREQFRKLPLTDDDLRRGGNLVDAIGRNRLSHKVSTEVWQEDIRGRWPKAKIVYVNGTYHFASGLEPRCSEFSKEYSPKFGSNGELLKHTLALAEKNDWIVLYKDHPNIKRYFPAAQIDQLENDRLIVIGDANINDIMDVADVTVSMGSKTVFLSLARGVPVCMVGPYTISPLDLEYGLVETTDLKSGVGLLLKRCREDRVDIRRFIEFVSRLSRYYLYSERDASDWYPKSAMSMWNDISEYINRLRTRVSIDDALMGGGAHNEQCNSNHK